MKKGTEIKLALTGHAVIAVAACDNVIYDVAKDLINEEAKYMRTFAALIKNPERADQIKQQQTTLKANIIVMQDHLEWVIKLKKSYISAQLKEENDVPF